MDNDKNDWDVTGEMTNTVESKLFSKFRLQEDDAKRVDTGALPFRNQAAGTQGGTLSKITTTGGGLFGTCIVVALIAAVGVFVFLLSAGTLDETTKKLRELAVSPPPPAPPAG